MGYPEGPLEPPPGWFPLREGDRIVVQDGWPYMGPGLARGEPAWAPVPEVPEGAGGFLHILLGNAEPEPGPPYVHTLIPPEPIGWDEDGNPVYPEPGPAFTVTDG